MAQPREALALYFPPSVWLPDLGLRSVQHQLEAGTPPGCSGQRTTTVWVGETSTQTKKGECRFLQHGLIW